MKFRLFICILLQSINLNLFAQIISIDQGITRAVVVGISDYQDEKIPDLLFADQDAEAFANFLRSKAGGSLDKDHLQVLTNQNATAGKVAAALYWLVEESQEGDQIFIYFSGHGDVEAKFRGQPGYLLCWDAPPQVYMAGGTLQLVSLQTIISTLSLDIKAKVTVITDACRAGKLAGSDSNGSQLTNANLSQQYANEIKILSCQPDEYSVEGEQWGGGRGAFSYHLLDALYGMADRDGNLGVELKEIDRYLEDHVSTEVAPHNQLPMTVGNGREKIVDVFPDILAQLQEGREGQLRMFKATGQRGIEDEVLVQADSNIVEIYFAFQQSLKNKEFLEPNGACADTYYEQLIREPKLERLHSTMRRNYAAALQDEAQQVMNILLKTGLTEDVLSHVPVSKLYKNYPAYLERAATLLGEQHYFYPVLQARKLFFEGYLLASTQSLSDCKKALDKFRKALTWQPEMPHAYWQMSFVYGNGLLEADSATFYAMKATELAPTWILPFITLNDFYSHKLRKYKQAKQMLEQARLRDSSSVLVWYKWANYYRMTGQEKKSVDMFFKVINGTGPGICFPCVHNDLGKYYEELNQFADAEAQLKAAIELDSTFGMGYSNLATLYIVTQRYKEAEELIIKALQLESFLFNSGEFNNFGWVYNMFLQRFEDAEWMYKKALDLDMNTTNALENLSILYTETGQWEKLKSLVPLFIETANNIPKYHYILAHVYDTLGDKIAAKKSLSKALEFNPPDYYLFLYFDKLFHQTSYGLSLEEIEKAILKMADKNGTSLIWSQQVLGYIFLRNNQFDKANEYFLKQMEANQGHDSYLSFIDYYAYQKKEKETLDWLDQYLEKGHYDSNDLNFDRHLDFLRQNPKFNTVIKRHFPGTSDSNSFFQPRNKEPFYDPVNCLQLANFYKSQGHLKDAERLYLKALELNPGYQQAIYQLNIIRQKIKD